MSPAQQRELLSLAQRQGILYFHQLPAPANGPPAEQTRPLLGQLLSGSSGDLQPLRPPGVEVSDTALDACQRDAVAKALLTPDICLIQGPPGTGKSRVVAEIVTQAVTRGERVLLLAPTPAAIDRVLEALTGRDVVFPLRLLGPGEALEALAPAVRNLTFSQRVHFLRSQAVPSARRAVKAQADRADCLRRDAAVWARLDELAARRQGLDQQRDALQARCDQIAREVQDEAASAETAATAAGFAAAMAACTRMWREAVTRRDAGMSELSNQAEVRRSELSAVATQLGALGPLVQAKQQGRWWTLAWWRATFRGNTASRCAELEDARQQIQTSLDALQEQIRSLNLEREQAESNFQEQRAHLVNEEVARRIAELSGEESALQQELDRLQPEWQSACQNLGPESSRPAEMTVLATQSARADWERELERAQEQQAFAREWAAFLEQAPEELSRRLPDYVNLVAATTTSLTADEHFGDPGRNGSVRPVHFDLLVLEDADRVTEAELLAVARRARRWVLVGEPETGDWKPRAKSAASSLQPPVFQCLWQHLHSDPRSLPYAWLLENERLLCRLRPVPAEQRPWLEKESVADHPDVELRILSVPRGQPALAEIVFPPSMTIDRAKQYIFQELQELPVRATAHSLRWVEEGDRLVLRLANQPCHHDLCVELEPGIRETLAGLDPEANGNHGLRSCWHTCCLQFDRAHGWHRQRAEDWVQQHLGLRDLGRTVRLDTLHRADANLALFLCDLLGGGLASSAALPDHSPGKGQAPGRNPQVAPTESVSDGCSAAVEFVPVPPPKGERQKGKGEKAQVSTSLSPCAFRLKGGAGLELDLSDPRQRERLPVELRADLPNQGFVNYLEAQAVVRALTALAQRPDVARSPDRATSAAGARPAVAVLAMYAAQAEVIRRLMRRERSLAASGFEIHVDIPSAFRHRDCQRVFLSLTRSHTHRAVTFGEGPHMLALATTRAREKLTLFGDPGTLVRRSQWEGPLEHLDEAAAARERELITHLVRYLQGQGPQPQAFHLCQGNGS